MNPAHLARSNWKVKRAVRKNFFNRVQLVWTSQVPRLRFRSIFGAETFPIQAYFSLPLDVKMRLACKWFGVHFALFYFGN